jgi:hypothetical protein
VPDINVYAVVLAAVSIFVLGGVWYSPALFGTRWKRDAGVTGQPGSGHPARVFGVSFVFTLIAAFAFAMWLGPQPPLKTALIQGLVAGVGFVATSFGINYQFSNRSTAMWLIDSGYHTVQFLLFGLILGLWH